MKSDHLCKAIQPLSSFGFFFLGGGGGWRGQRICFGGSFMAQTSPWGHLQRKDFLGLHFRGLLNP